jgi:hypothetical protein
MIIIETRVLKGTITLMKTISLMIKSSINSTNTGITFSASMTAELKLTMRAGIQLLQRQWLNTWPIESLPSLVKSRRMLWTDFVESEEILSKWPEKLVFVSGMSSIH